MLQKRKTFHQCAEELETLSQEFREAFISDWQSNKVIKNKLIEVSQEATEILSILAFDVRSEQDYGISPHRNNIVGMIKDNANINDFDFLKEHYNPPYNKLGLEDGFTKLNLRNALNKIVHRNPAPKMNSFCANADYHDLILYGQDRTKKWIAVISVIDLCKTIQSIPDRPIIKN